MNTDKMVELTNEIVKINADYQEKMKVLDNVLELKESYIKKLQELISCTTAEVAEIKKTEILMKNKSKDTTKRSNSMNKVILNILGDSKEGLTFKDLLIKVNEVIANGEYHTNSEKVANLVSQAISKLKSQSLIVANVTLDDNKSVYSVVRSEAA